MSDIMDMIAEKRGIKKSAPVRKGGLDYYRLCHDTDPSFGVGTAIVEWCMSNIGEAKKIISNLDLEMEYDFYEDWTELVENTYSNVLDAFSNGRFSSFSDDDPYFYIDAYGHVASCTETAYRRFVKQCISTNLDEISEASDIPDELKQVIAIWMDADD